MHASSVRTTLAVLTCALAALVTAGAAGSALPATTNGQVAGSVETKVVLKRFADGPETGEAAGKRVKRRRRSSRSERVGH